MNVKGFLTVPLILLFGLGQTGCSSQPTQQHSAHDHSEQPAASPSNTQIEKAIQDELKGLSTIEAAVDKGDFPTASKTFEPLHDEFHAAVLPPIQAKNAKLAEDMHSKFDALDAALESKAKDQTRNAIQSNRESLTQAAKELGIAVK